MANRLSFGLVLHQHQPVGNFPWVFAQVYEACYAPLLAAFERHPTIKVNLHYSGSLLDWLMVEHPDYLVRLAALARRGQVELLTGGYYEPILTILPESDQFGQITKLSTFIRQQFSQEPQGMWLAERVWEPQLPTPLQRAGVRYTILDDMHFLMAGLTEDQLQGYYITEDLGHPVAVFPNPKLMRELIPWKPLHTIEAALRTLHQTAGPDGRLIILADDGEKFGSWPNTHDLLWRRKEFDRFLEMFENNADWLETVKLGDYLKQHEPVGRIYFPSASYAEMMAWALPPAQTLRLERARHEARRNNQGDLLDLLQGGNWRNFAAKYPEANNFHKKMLRVHERIHQVATQLGAVRTQEALDYLWKGQCNCGYWHGVFGGLYLSDIRSAIYQNLIRAEVIADSALLLPEPTVTVTDFDCDGREELLIEGSQMDLYIDPHDGGSIFEWDWKQVPFNVLDTLTRREEAYHQLLLTGNVVVVPPADPMAVSEHPLDPDRETEASIHDIVQAKEPGLANYLHYDRWRRTTLREHFLTAKTTQKQFIDGDYVDQGDFAGASFSVQVEGSGAGALVVSLSRDGTVRDRPGSVLLRLRKAITFAADSAEIRVAYTLHNISSRAIATRFAMECNWGMLGGGGNPNAWYTIDGDQVGALDSHGKETQIHKLALINAGYGVQVTIEPTIPADLWRHPVETVSNSEAGFERDYQCSCTLLQWPVQLPAGDRWSVTVRFTLAQPE